MGLVKEEETGQKVKEEKGRGGERGVWAPAKLILARHPACELSIGVDIDGLA